MVEKPRPRTVTFGLALDEGAWPAPAAPGGGTLVAGPQGLLHHLETWLGLQQPPRDEGVLRIEKYRQALRLRSRAEPEAFYRRSFEADAFATAADLLARRDELLMGGWDFRAGPDAPPRLRTLAAVETIFRGPDLPAVVPGTADRLLALRRALRPGLPLRRIDHLEPLDRLPRPWRQLLEELQDLGTELRYRPAPPPSGDTDLAHFQRALLPDAETTGPQTFRGDGSLVLLRGKRDTDLAAFLAGLCRKNPSYRPLCLLAGGDDTFNQALIQEGLPSMGIPSASLARPSLQILKLITAFLWEPLDPFKLIQFVSLSEKPLDEGLGYRMARALAESPGLRSEAWGRHVLAYLDELRRNPGRHSPADRRRIERQYRFLLDRRRYPILGAAPRQDIIPLFLHLERWAVGAYDEDQPHASLLVLAEQARRIRELLENLPEDQLSYLELERVVRTVYQPAPVELFPPEAGHLPALRHPAGLGDASPDTLWWNFVDRSPAAATPRWHPQERAWLEAAGVWLERPADANERHLFLERQPVLRTRERLLLVWPELVRGEPCTHHPFLADLQARFDGLDRLVVDLDNPERVAALLPGLALTGRRSLEHRPLGQPPPFLQLSPEHRLDVRETETFTSLEDLFYYPHKWVFRHFLGLRSSPILQIVDDRKLFGNLAHRLLDRLLRQERILQWPENQVLQWVEREAATLFAREGSVLLLYGREPDRVQFTIRTQRAALSLLNALRGGGWEVLDTEMGLEGKFEACATRGRADLVLRRAEEQAVIDLKWGGYGYRRDAIRNREDLQLAFYAFLLGGEGQVPHTAYFIIERGALLARNREAFQSAETPQPELDRQQTHRELIEAMRATYRWRRDQLRAGRVEMRCAATLPALHEAYGSDLLDVLEMREADATWDDYRSLMYLVD